MNKAAKLELGKYDESELVELVEGDVHGASTPVISAVIGSIGVSVASVGISVASTQLTTVCTDSC